MRIDNLAAPQLTELWSLREDTLVEAGPEPGGPLTVHTRWGPVHFEQPGEALREALQRMQLGPVSLSNVLPGFPGRAADARAGGHDPEVAQLLDSLDQLPGALVRTLALGGTPLLSVVPIAPDAAFAPLPAPRERACRLSRFTVLRYAEGGLRLESPLTRHRVQLHRPEAAALLGRLDGSDRTGPADLPDHVEAEAIGYLVGAGLAVLAEQEGADGLGQPPRFAEDEDPRLAGWSPDDLMLHSRSRLGHHDHAFGATYAGAVKIPAEPPVKPVTAARPIALFRPDLAELAQHDEPFSSVLERRRSVRRYGSEPLTLRQVGELLFRTARVRGTGTGPDGAAGSAWTSRPYPSMGSVYALELYLVAGTGTALPPGAYHYDPLGHRLEPLEASADALAELTAAARATAGSAEDPPLLIVLTARFNRVMHAFSGIAYTSLMKDVGVLMHHLYLVSTAMGLAPCALAAGNSHTAVRAFGLDWPVESSVGEFAVGTLPSGPKTAPGQPQNRV